MAPQSRRLEETLAELGALRADPRADAAAAKLRQAIAKGPSHAAALAADIAREFEIEELCEDLAAGFARFLEKPEKSDPGCRAKEAIAEALQWMGHEDERVFLRGVQYVQMEPVWGGQADTAAGLRGACARGLVRTNHPDALVELAQLLADPELPARVAAARCFAHWGHPAGAAPLRLKVLSGDPEPELIGECMTALMAIDPQGSLPFLAGFLDRDDRVLAEAAALGLGESRHPEAFPVLRGWWERTVDPDLARAALTSIAVLRLEETLDFLLEMVAREPGPLARDALAALGVHRDDESLAERVRQTAQARDDLDLGPAVQEAFGPDRFDPDR
ncbi:MAG: HEAT repeat domain-containing protein [Proteobacteria bacterium]|nr:HEAT repeat domain-containing protein [Pseudomonadota bacterium]